MPPRWQSGLTIVLRIGFVLYALALVVATHWPRLNLQEAPIQASDKVYHFAAFLLWTLLIAASGFFGRPLSRRNVQWSVAIASVYAPLDELTQALPGVNRDVTALDLVANLTGVVVGGAVLLGLARLKRRGPSASK